ncbi:arginine--tRNA ligase [Candidatus Methylacidiphilum fumarolicum]|uniref:Arginine--tRNA ligase n=2 Tax=Candidatus Methylacidiphilum fumarolicum TaxID=591154 RepID=I0JW04_METFB|nr:arginine--tRNA ligase [Candidatus Methylacidiphilum fumarolicum]MBW6415666.1 arginine--tRNA ligase [Candidatus Methylacidiphilum fumarolicum]TFE66803.1 arginine--tRNA ligase [Candidatus Methylacidiphilum fumarolicum]TFE71727.1 arginine--tRNA ligase [Candidatus Methylacidiphilum fumarolicum]TFE73657.1 arginine--tRNA ligase [Candidatus Methylacidiphilum fumarolicum]TFE77619.1 arginine--tRNA ligase [Candidatus Methylacidiphilum fumarolicum]
MKIPQDWIFEKLKVALSEKFGQTDHIPIVEPCSNPSFGDYQTNVAFLMASQLKENPRKLAEEFARIIGDNSVTFYPEVGGNGFINFRVKPKAYLNAFLAIRSDPRLGIEQTKEPQTIVIDFSSPNIAKELHVGHLRSTILGDVLKRLNLFLGHRVIADNHLGDWGTQFGMVLLGYKRYGDPLALAEKPLEYLEGLYVRIQKEAKESERIKEEAKRELQKLQSGDSENLKLWDVFVHASLKELDKIYQKLNVKFDYSLGESVYNPMLPGVVEELLQKGIARYSEGAVCVFFNKDFPELANKPMIIQKTDGAYLYATTDIATLLFRLSNWQAQRIIYVTDSRQKLHFQQLFALARLLGIDIQLEHVYFGSILGEDKKPLKTREGTSIKLRELLEEAVNRAYQIIDEKRKDLSEDKKREIAHAVGIGALKYADLSQNRILDYIFSWEKLLSLEGNTAPYLINAHVRICSILKKAASSGYGSTLGFTSLKFETDTLHPQEIELMKAVLSFKYSLFLAAKENSPHHLCNYLYNLAKVFHKFYEQCPVLGASTESSKQLRLAFCDFTQRTLSLGLELLGIEPLKEM